MSSRGKIFINFALLTLECRRTQGQNKISANTKTSSSLVIFFFLTQGPVGILKSKVTEAITNFHLTLVCRYLAYQCQKGKIGSNLACDYSMPSGGKIFTSFFVCLFVFFLFGARMALNPGSKRDVHHRTRVGRRVVSAFLACHQCYCEGSSLAWGLNFRALVCDIF